MGGTDVLSSPANRELNGVEDAERVPLAEVRSNTLRLQVTDTPLFVKQT